MRSTFETHRDDSLDPDYWRIQDPRRREDWEGAEFDHPDHTHFQEYDSPSRVRFTQELMDDLRADPEFRETFIDSLTTPEVQQLHEALRVDSEATPESETWMEILKDRTDNSPINLFTDLFLPPYAKSEAVKKYTLDRTTDPNANWVQQFNGLTDEEIDAVAARLNLETE